MVLRPLSKLIIVILAAVMLSAVFATAWAAFNPQINYQGKLTDENSLAVADGNYNMRFKLCAAADCSGGSDPIWTETRTMADRVPVTNGLFSVLLGSVTNISAVDFDQTLYLEVSIGGTDDSPAWEILTPRKKLGAVPAAFEAAKLNGKTWEAPGAIGETTQNTAAFTTLSSNATTTFTGNVGIGTTVPGERLTLAGGNFLQTAGNPTLEGTYETFSTATAVFVSGKYAYVADDVSGLQIIDISNPTSPTAVATYDTGLFADDIYVSGKYAYVTDNHSLQIIDVSNPAAPSLAGTYNTPNYANDVYVSGKYAYIADDTSGLQIIDVSNPAAPSLAGTYDTSGTAIGVYVSGKYAYVADSDSGLQIIDVSNPAAPSLAGTYDTPSYANGVYVSGKYAYVADYVSGLQVINISNPALPTLSGTYNTPGYAREVYVYGKYAYVADSHAGLQIINISNPAAPSLAGTYNTPGYVYGIYVSGKYAYVADGDSGLQVIDINGIDTPALSVGSIQTDSIDVAGNVGINNDLSVSGGLNIGGTSLFQSGVTVSATSTFVGALGIKESGNTPAYYTYLIGGDQSTNIVYTLPAALPISNKILQSTSAGVLSWADVATSTQWTTNGSSIYYSSGYVGIGTATPDNPLVVNGQSSGNAPFYYNISSRDTASMAADAGGGIGFEGNDGISYDRTFGFIQGAKENDISGNYAGYLRFFTRPNGLDPAERLRIDSGGNVGIGTTAPLADLDVKGSGDGRVMLGTWSGDSDYGAITLNGSTDPVDYNFLSEATWGDLYINRPTGSAISFRESNGTDQMTILSGGNVGIGTNIPTAKLTIKDGITNLVYGDEILANGNFSQGNAGWTVGAGWSTASGAAVHTAGNGDSLSQDFSVTAGLIYRVQFTVSGMTAGELYASDNLDYLGLYNRAIFVDGNGNYSLDIYAETTTTDTLIFGFLDDSFNGSIDNISVRQVTTSAPSASMITLLNNDGTTGLEIRSGGGNGFSNVAIGEGAFKLNIGGYYNTAVGKNALAANTLGSSNSAFGTGSLTANTLGINNSAFGNGSLSGNLSGVYNSAFGSGALNGNISGNSNTAIGYGAGNEITTGSNNIIIGYNSNLPAGDSSNMLDIGDLIFATGLADNGEVYKGNVGIGTAFPAEKFTLAGGNFFQTAGDPTLEGSYDTSGNAQGVSVSGKYAYVADGASGLQIIDISNPASTTLAGTFSDASVNNYYGVSVSGKYAYVVDDSGGGFNIIDISNPASPTLAGTYHGTNGEMYAIYVSGKYAYVNEGFGVGFRIIDISNPASPTLAATYFTPGTPEGIYVSGKYAYVADGDYGIQIIDISNPASPTLAGTYNTSSYSYGVSVSGKYAYVADGTSGLQIIDISNPASTTLAGAYNTPGSARSVSVSGKYAYVADGTSGLQIIDISNPASTTLAGAYNTPGSARSVSVSGKYAYVADYGSGLQVIDINGIDAPALTVGNIQTGSLSVADNVDISNDLSVSGGLSVNGAVLLQKEFSVFATSTFIGNVGIGTTAPGKKLDVMQAATASQIRISQSGSVYSELYADSAGDLRISATGGDIRALDENLWVCAGGACPSITPSGNGNLVVEGAITVGTSSATCDASNRGTIRVEQGAAGATDKLWSCLKTSANTYNWVLVARGD